MHATMTERLEGFAKSEFEVILRERRVVEGLNALEGLVGDARRRKTRASDERGDNADAVPAP
jgi:kinetochore protein NNF1